MSDARWIEGGALESLLPHREVNLLIDGFRAQEAASDSSDGTVPTAESTLMIASDDPRGRHIFLRGEDTGGQVLMEAALAEHLALSASCALSGELGPGEIALFSRISKFKLAREAPAGERLFAEVKRLRDKGSFRRFDGAIRSATGDAVATGEIMAYATVPRESGREGREEAGKLVEPPEVGEIRPVDRALFRWKRPEMVFVDELVGLSADGALATFRYAYPPDHPFCGGHFPGNPIMMGVTQWIAACDAAAWLMHQRGERAGDARFSADAEIIRESGALVAEVRGLVFRCGAGEAGAVPPARIESTQRVGFRDLVRPGETIFVRVRAQPC